MLDFRLEDVSTISGRMRWGTATPIQAVPLQAVAAPGGFPTAPPLAILQEGSQAAVVEGHAPMDKRVQQQLRRIEKLVYLCLVLALYAIFKK